MIQAGTYSATLQYLKAVKAAGTKDSDAVAKKLKELPVDDVFAQGGKVLENGRMVHDLYLFEVKKPSESKKPWDYYKQLAVVPGDKAFFSRQGQRLSADEVIGVAVTTTMTRRRFGAVSRRYARKGVCKKDFCKKLGPKACRFPRGIGERFSVAIVSRRVD